MFLNHLDTRNTRLIKKQWNALEGERISRRSFKNSFENCLEFKVCLISWEFGPQFSMVLSIIKLCAIREQDGYVI